MREEYLLGIIAVIEASQVAKDYTSSISAKATMSASQVESAKKYVLRNQES